MTSIKGRIFDIMDECGSAHPLSAGVLSFYRAHKVLILGLYFYNKIYVGIVTSVIILLFKHFDFY